ncbi:MAG: hypothetical protein V1798_06815 [Pseudomonadota bacterium]
MRLSSFSLCIFSLYVVFPAAVRSQDVCCILSKISGSDVTTMATARSTRSCRAGTTDSGFRICNGFADPNNLCATTPSKKQCGMCGYFWAGSSCVAEDPVKKAKKELKDQEKNEKAGTRNVSTQPPAEEANSPASSPEFEGPAALPPPE